jgi:hypothetical protein
MPNGNLSSGPFWLSGEANDSNVGPTVTGALNSITNPGRPAACYEPLMVIKNSDTTVSKDIDSSTLPAGYTSLFLEQDDDQGIDVDVNELGLAKQHSQNIGGTHAGESLATQSLAAIDKFIPNTGFANYVVKSACIVDEDGNPLKSDGTPAATRTECANPAYDIFFPKFGPLRKESIIDCTPDGVGVDVPGGGIRLNPGGPLDTSYHVYVGEDWLGDNVIVHMAFLGKPYAGGKFHGRAVTDTVPSCGAPPSLRPCLVRPGENDIEYMCMLVAEPTSNLDPVPIKPRITCERGRFIEGVIGFVLRHVNPDPSDFITRITRQSPGTNLTYMKSFRQGNTTWNMSFQFFSNLAVLFERDGNSSYQYAWGLHWNSNPNDYDPSDPNGRVNAFKTNLALMSVKTATNAKGISISPYTFEWPLGYSGPVAGHLNSCEDDSVDVTHVPGAFPATPCADFQWCTHGDKGVHRECSWVVDHVGTCNPTAMSVVGMGANVLDCAHPTGEAPGAPTVLRICPDIGGCTESTMLGQSAGVCGTWNPSVAFTCPLSGYYSVMKGPDDGAALVGVKAGTRGGGVPGRPGAVLPATMYTRTNQETPVDDGYSVISPCPAGVTGLTRDCGWSARVPGNTGSGPGAYYCPPGETMTIETGLMPDCSPGLGSIKLAAHPMVRVCNGERSCTETSWDKLTENDGVCGAVSTAATFTCGSEGIVTVMLGERDQPNVVPSVTFGVHTKAGDTIGTAVFHKLPDVASSGDLYNDFVIHRAYPYLDVGGSDPTLARPCDYRYTHGIGAVNIFTDFVCRPIELLSAYKFRAASYYDTTSTWNRCVTYADPINATIVPSQCLHDSECDPPPGGGAPPAGSCVEDTTSAPCPGLSSSVCHCPVYQTRQVIAKLRHDPAAAGVPLFDHFLVPIKGVMVSPETGPEEVALDLDTLKSLSFPGGIDPGPGVVLPSGVQSCAGVPCCGVSGNDSAAEVTCSLVMTAGKGFILQSQTQPTGVPGYNPATALPDPTPGYSHQFNDAGLLDRTTILFNHDWIFTVTWESPRCGDFRRNDGGSCPKDEPIHPSTCLGGQAVDCKGTHATVCPAECPYLDQLDDNFQWSAIPLSLKPVPALSHPSGDHVPPVIDLPIDGSHYPAGGPAEADSVAGHSFTIATHAHDDVDGPNVPVYASVPSGFSCPVGHTDIQFYAYDQAGNYAGPNTVTCDVTDVRLTLPKIPPVDATSAAGADVAIPATLAVRTYDDLTSAEDPSGTCSVGELGPPAFGGVTCTATIAGKPVDVAPGATTTFPIGATVVACQVPDSAEVASPGSGTIRTGSFTVKVVDRTPPVVTPPSGPVADPACPDPVKVAATLTTSDWSPPVIVDCTPATVANGTTTPVHCVATDSAPAKNTTTVDFTLTVTSCDTVPPVLSLPGDLTVAATSASGASVSFTATATDAVDGPVPVTCTPASGSLFALGTTTVSCSASDHSGNTATGSFTVTVSYDFGPGTSCGIQQPINVDGSSVFKGKSIPVKFKLCGASAGITSANATLSIALISGGTPGTVNEAASTSAADTGNTFRYDASSGQYIFNLSTATMTTGMWRLYIDLHDGAPPHTVDVGFRL